MNSNPRASGAGFLKWIVLLAFVALAGVAVFLYAAQDSMRSELDQLRAETAQLQQDKTDLEQQQAKNAKPAEDPASLELVKLRAEVARLRPIEKQFQQLQAESQQMRGTMAELQRANAEAATIKNQNLQLQGVLQAKAATDLCINNLRQIAGAKAQWALENKKTAIDVPTDIDLFPKYAPQKPVCPAGGIYTLGPVQVKPTCNTPGHNF